MENSIYYIVNTLYRNQSLENGGMSKVCFNLMSKVSV